MVLPLVLRAGRAGTGIVSVMLSRRSAGQELRNRLTVLLVTTAIVTPATGRLLWEFGDTRTLTPTRCTTRRWRRSLGS
jgi:hypothetical protein